MRPSPVGQIELLFDHLATLGGPDIVTLQEVLDRKEVLSLAPRDGRLVTIQGLTAALRLIQAQLKPFVAVGGFQYHVLYAAALINPPPGLLFQRTDEALILSHYPIVRQDLLLLHSALFDPADPTKQASARLIATSVSLRGDRREDAR